MQLLSPLMKPVVNNYQDLQENVRFGDGHLWQKIDQKEQYYNGMAFTAEAPTNSLLKTAGLVLGGSLFFTGATTYHLYKTGHEAFLCVKGIRERFKLAKSEKPSQKLWEFVKEQEKSNYEATLQTASQMVKSYACWIPFAMLPLPHIFNPPTWMPLASLHPIGWLTDTNLGFYVGLGFIAYALYDPRYPKVFLNQIEKWIVAPLQGENVPEGKMEEEDSKLGVHYRIQEAFEFKVPISKYLGWKTVALPDKMKSE